MLDFVRSECELNGTKDGRPNVATLWTCVAKLDSRLAGSESI